jgi:hypothetical protein
MDAGPSTAAWIALAMLVALFSAAVLLERARDAAPGDKPALPGWAITASAAVAACPLVGALMLGAPVSTLLWWLLLGPVATAVLLAVIGTPALVAIRWQHWRGEVMPQERMMVGVIVILSVASALSLPAVCVAVVLAEGDVPLATAVSLTVAYVIWRAAIEVARRSPHLSGNS